MRTTTTANAATTASTPPSPIATLFAPAPAPAPGGTGVLPADAAGFVVDCDCCSLQGTDACQDCVVTFLLDRDPDDAVVVDAREARAMRMLERAGLVPSLRFDQGVDGHGAWESDRRGDRAG